MKNYTGAIILIIIGIVFQLDIFFDDWNFFSYVIRNYWPSILIIIGISMLFKKNPKRIFCLNICRLKY